MDFMCAMKHLLEIAIDFSLTITKLGVIFTDVFVKIYNGWGTEVCNE